MLQAHRGCCPHPEPTQAAAVGMVLSTSLAVVIRSTDKGRNRFDHCCDDDKIHDLPKTRFLMKLGCSQMTKCMHAQEPLTK